MSAAAERAGHGSGGREPQAIHATAVVLGEAGLIIRGRSGAGKTSLALALLDLARNHGLFAELVGDDRVYVAAVNGRVIVAGHPAIAGKIERRGIGIVECPYEAKAVARLVVDLLDDGPHCGIRPRLPEPVDRITSIEATELPCLSLRVGTPSAELAAQILLELPAAMTDR